MRHFIIISNTVDTNLPLSLNSLTAYGRLDVICRCISASFYLSDTFRKEVLLSVILLKSGKIMHIEGDKVRGINPDERAIAGVLKQVFKGKNYPGITFFEGSFDTFIVDHTPIVLMNTESPLENFPQKYRSFIIGDQVGYSDEFKELINQFPKASLGPNTYLSSQTITILHYLLDKLVESQI